MTKAKKRLDSPLSDLVTLRKSFGENQNKFWSRFGVTQSGGSRYETGRNLPAPVAILMLAFVSGKIDDLSLTKLRSEILKARETLI
jgi:DNA-binding transcriptional regulator YiaG